VNRRELLLLVGGALAAPGPLHAQQKSMPVIGILGANTPEIPGVAAILAAFRRGLGETSYVEGQNVAIEYRWAERQPDRLPALAADLVARKVDVIVTQGGDSATSAAQQATSTIPILFHTNNDPVATGLVASLARPGGNLTGVNLMFAELMPKRLELLLEVVPQSSVIALLVNPDELSTGRVIGHMQEAARAKRVDLHILRPRTEGEIDSAFANLVELRADGLVLGPIGFRPQIAALALRHAVPAIAPGRDFPSSGGLLSYGPSVTAAYHLKGIYTGRILKGEKPADLPVQQPATFELVINLKTAEAVGLKVQPSILARATEVIE